jgi:hypothetical protein
VKKKGGRLGWDLELIKKAITIKIDFKYNVLSIKNYPQIIDVYSSKLGDLCYPTEHYCYLNFKDVSLETYLNFIWQHNAHEKNKFFSLLNKKYKNNFIFKKDFKKSTKDGIKIFIKKVRLDITALNLILSSVNKIYLLYYKGI